MSSGIVNTDLGNGAGIQALGGIRPSRGVADAVQQQLKTAVHKELIKRLDLDKLSEIQETACRGRSSCLCSSSSCPLLMEQGVPIERQLPSAIAWHAKWWMRFSGLDPLEPLLNDNTISDILVNTHKQIYIERRGKLEKTSVVFKDEKAPDAHHRQDCLSGVGRRCR